MNTNNYLRDTPLHLAILKNDIDGVKTLLELNSSDPNLLKEIISAKNRNGDTPLHHANHVPELLELMLEASSSICDISQIINIKNTSGATPLHYASDTDLSAMNILLKYGARIDVKNDDGDNALHYAVMYSSEAVIILLHKLSDEPECIIDINAQNNEGILYYILPLDLERRWFRCYWN